MRPDGRTDRSRFASLTDAPALAGARAFVLALAVALASPAPAQSPAPEALPSTSVAPAQTATAKHGMVASQDAFATRVGVAILERGGNAVDAAVAVGFALAVSMPRETGRASWRERG